MVPGVVTEKFFKDDAKDVHKALGRQLRIEADLLEMVANRINILEVSYETRDEVLFIVNELTTIRTRLKSLVG